MALRGEIRDDFERVGEELDRPLIDLEALEAQHGGRIGRGARRLLGFGDNDNVKGGVKVHVAVKVKGGVNVHVSVNVKVNVI